jgi:hypothetical protein
MAFTRKNWQDGENGGTPLSAEAVEDIETRVTDYADERAAAVASSLGEAITTGLAGKASSIHTHAASAITVTPSGIITATNVQAALAQLATAIQNAGGGGTGTGLPAGGPGVLYRNTTDGTATWEEPAGLSEEAPLPPGLSAQGSSSRAMREDAVIGLTPWGAPLTLDPAGTLVSYPLGTSETSALNNYYANKQLWSRIVPYQTCTVRYGLRANDFAPGATARVGIYADLDGLPGALIDQHVRLGDDPNATAAGNLLTQQYYLLKGEVELVAGRPVWLSWKGEGTNGSMIPFQLCNPARAVLSPMSPDSAPTGRVFIGLDGVPDGPMQDVPQNTLFSSVFDSFPAYAFQVV